MHNKAEIILIILIFTYFCDKLPASTNYIATQYWTWYTAGPNSPHWSDVTYGEPIEKWYSSSDPVVAAHHIKYMTSNGINVLSYGFFNQAGDHTCWHHAILDPDQAFKDGVMRASNFNSIKFNISYDLATRAYLTHRAENGFQSGYPVGIDALPNVHFFDPSIQSNDGNGYPSFDFSLKDSNGFYIYDELLEHDFKYFAENYFKKSNYFTINNQCVVFIYNSWRFNNGGNGQITKGFARAFNRIRTNIYKWYGFKLYLVGDFVSWNNRDRAQYYKNSGFFRYYDAVTGWNIVDSPYFVAFPHNSLSHYSQQSKTVQDNFRTAVKSTSRDYRKLLPEPANNAYGPSADSTVDFVPILSLSFRTKSSDWCFYAGKSGEEEVKNECTIVKTQRDGSTLAQENATLIYSVAFNQWSEGQILEPTATGSADTFPGRAGWIYLDAIKRILGPGD